MTTAVEHATGDEMKRFAFWLRYPPRGRRPMGDSTVIGYIYTVQRFHLYLNGREVSQKTMEEFLRELETSGNSPRSVGRHIYAVRVYFAFLGLRLELGAPAFQKWLPRWLTDKEWTQLLQTAERPLWEQGVPVRGRTRALFHRAVLMVYGGAGLRLSEGCALRQEDVDLAGYIRVLGKGGVEKWSLWKTRWLRASSTCSPPTLRPGFSQVEVMVTYNPGPCSPLSGAYDLTEERSDNESCTESSGRPTRRRTTSEKGAKESGAPER